MSGGPWSKYPEYDEEVLREKVAWGPVPAPNQWRVRRRLARAARRRGQARSRIARRARGGDRW